MSLSVGQVARLTGVTVRTLHHYDAIGLLSPSERTPAGYRRYTEADLDRLRTIIGYRELDFPLDRIAAMLDDPDADIVSHMRRQHTLLTNRAGRIQRMIGALERLLEAHAMNYNLTPEEREEVWGDFRPEEYEAEAQERWGGSDSYRQSQARTKQYTKDDWLAIKREGAEINERLAALMTAGTPATSVEAMDLAEAHRQHISRWFYDCSYEIHRGLGQMYVDDPRFTATYEGVGEGFARYLRDAIVANADRHE